MATTSVVTAPSTTPQLHRYPTDDPRLAQWRHKGWLTPPHGHDPAGLSAQQDWLGRLDDFGRVLDDEDAAGGWRLRRTGCRFGLRVAGSDREAGMWLPLWSIETWLDWPEHRPYTIAQVQL